MDIMSLPCADNVVDHGKVQDSFSRVVNLNLAVKVLANTVGLHNNKSVTFAEACYGIEEISKIIEEELNIIYETIYEAEKGQ